MTTLHILGTGCPKCQLLYEHAQEAAQALGIQHQLIKVTGIQDIMTCGVMMTPALAINGVVKCIGRVPSVDEIKATLQEQQ